MAIENFFQDLKISTWVMKNKKYFLPSLLTGIVFLLARDKSQETISFLQWQLSYKGFHLQSWHILVFILCITIGIYISVLWDKIHTSPPQAQKFVEYAGFLWRINESIYALSHLDTTPFCSEHKIKLLFADQGLYCPMCNEIQLNNKETQCVGELDMLVSRLHEAAESTAERKLHEGETEIIN